MARGALEQVVFLSLGLFDDRGRCCDVYADVLEISLSQFWKLVHSIDQLHHISCEHLKSERLEPGVHL